ncbi:MAG TPA: hypothetical protein VJ724_05710, partial [Tahibacter sp.]|nr:hypothetical protein [Tahibacter sp.]
LGLGITQMRGAVASAPPPGTERVQNGDFSSDTGWSGANWTIAAGVATNNDPGSLTNVLATPLSGGESFELSIDVTANPLNSGLIVRLANSTGTPAFQTIYSADGMAGTKTASGTVGGVYDWLVIISADDAGMVIDNVSLIA